MVEPRLNGLKCSQIDLINGHADKAGLVFVLKRSRLRKEYLVDGAVMPSQIADKSRHDVLAQTISVIHVLHIKNIARMLPVQCRNKFAPVKLSIGKRRHFEVDAEHGLCARHDTARYGRR